MSCYNRKILSRYQDGSLNAAESRRIAAHLDACAPCREAFATLGRAGLLLRVTVGSKRSVECPTDEELGAYLGGVMRAEDRERIERHLADCRVCLHEVADLSAEGALEASNESPAPDARAMARFRALVPSTVSRKLRIGVMTSWLGRAAAVAAVVAAAAVAGWLTLGREETRTIEIPITADTRPLNYVTAVSFASGDGLSAPSGSAEMGRFARDAAAVLREIERVRETPSREAFELVREDLLSSGLLDTVSRLRPFADETRDRAFLNDCEYVFQQVVKAESRDLASPNADLARIISEIRRLKLTETARLVEMEGSKSQWLAGL